MNTHDIDIELPPLPDWMSRFQIPADDLEDSDFSWLDCRMKDYARAAIEADRQRRGEPRLDAPAQVGHTRFGQGVPWATVIGAAQRYHAIENTPTKEQERIKKAAERIKALQPAERDPTLPYEQALSELIDKIIPGLDSGDILADAQTASAALTAEPVKDETLWCLHILGPDEVHAAPSKAYAEVAAGLHNARFGEVSKESGVMCKAVVAPWPHDSASHARGLANFVSNWIAPQPADPTVKESLSVAEPVAWMQRSYLNQIRESNVALHNVVIRGSKLDGDGDVVPLYAHPQPAETVACFKCGHAKHGGECVNVAPQPSEPEHSGWYCAHCQRGVDSSEVTFHEQHLECGRVITDDSPPQPAEPSPAQIRRAKLRADPIKAAALDRARERIATELANSAEPVDKSANLQGNQVDKPAKTQGQTAEPVKCPDPSMGEHACSNRDQCWEPCGELGKSIEHAKVADLVHETPLDSENNAETRMDSGFAGCARVAGPQSAGPVKADIGITISHTDQSVREEAPPSYSAEAEPVKMPSEVTEILQGIIDANWKDWQELASPDEFVRWAKSRAAHALSIIARYGQPAQPADGEEIIVSLPDGRRYPLPLLPTGMGAPRFRVEISAPQPSASTELTAIHSAARHAGFSFEKDDKGVVRMVPYVQGHGS